MRVHRTTTRATLGRPRFNHDSILMIGNFKASHHDCEVVLRLLDNCAQLMAELPTNRDWLDPQLEARLAADLRLLNLLEQ